MAALLVLTIQTPTRAIASPVFELPFPCNETWYAATYAGHLPSVLATDWNGRPGDGDLDRGRPVLAGVAGFAFPKADSGYGNYVDVEVGAGWVARYAHLDSVAVTSGQPVDPLTQIGTVGGTGDSSAAHLHYEQRLNGTPQHVSFRGTPIQYVDYPQSLPHTSGNCGSDQTVSFVALGDSFTSGEGNPPYEEPTDTPDNRCHRSLAAYPHQLTARAPDLGLRAANIACSGAETVHVTSEGFNSELEQVTSLEGISATGAVRGVALTIGGNDVDFGPTVTFCFVAPRRCDTDARTRQVRTETDALAPTLTSTFSMVQAAAPEARVFALGYPRLFAEGEKCGPWLVSQNERRWMNRATEDLNAVIRRAAGEAGAVFVDTTHAFAGHELCYGRFGSRDTWVNRPTKPMVHSLHPNALGHAALADKLAESMRVHLGTPSFEVGQGASNRTAFLEAHAQAGGEVVLGRPVNAVHAWHGGCAQDFLGGSAGKSAIMSAGCANAAFAVAGTYWSYIETRWGSAAAAVIGYPYNAPHRWGSGMVQDFANGSLGHSILMLRDGTDNAFNVFGGVKDKYVQLDGAEGRLGYPISDEYDWEGEKRQDFEAGSIIWNAVDGARLLEVAPPDRRAVVSYDEMRPGAPRWGAFYWAYQPFVAQSNTITYVGVTVGHSEYTSGATLPERLRIRLCTDPDCATTLADVAPQIVNYGNTEADIGDVSVVKGATYFVRWDRPTAVRWDTFWWGGSGSGRQDVATSDRMQMVVRGYDR